MVGALEPPCLAGEVPLGEGAPAADGLSLGKGNGGHEGFALRRFLFLKCCRTWRRELVSGRVDDVGELADICAALACL